MVERPGSMRHVWTALALALLAGPVSCKQCDEHETASCHELPNEAVEAFTVLLKTGDDGSDADIYFCVDTGAGLPDCAELDNSFEDDFQEDQVQEFTVSLNVDAGELAAFYVENRGGALFSNDDWEIASLTVAATTESGEHVIYEEPELCDAHLEAGERYRPRSCVY